jgi:Raf kinase inhibitor-like YbhB/YbcL family protein
MANLAPNPYDFLPEVPAFELSSEDVAAGGMLAEAHVFNGFGFSGENRSPHLRWSGAPEGTLSYVVNVVDPDAPTGSGFWHWTVVNLAADVTELPTGAGADDASLPGSAFHVRNDVGSHGWVGPAPAAGPASHRYIFTVHALDVDSLDVTADTSPAAVGFNLYFHTLARAQFIAEYARKES